MNERVKRIEELLVRWEAACVTEQEERELRRLIRTTELPADLKWLRVFFRGAEALSQEALPARLAGWTPQAGGVSGGTVAGTGETLSLRGRRIPLRRRRAAWGFAAAAAACGIMLGVWQVRRPLCYIDGMAVYDRETALSATEYLGGLAELEAPAQLLDQLMATEK